MNDKRLKSLVEGIVKGLVDHPTSVAVTIKRPHEALLEIEIYTHSDDVKMVIGKSGKNVQSIRNLVYAMVAKSKVRCYLTVEENEKNVH